MKAVELFSGAGGLALGISLAGFKPLAVVEWDKWACDTIRLNQSRGFPLVAEWPLREGDVRQFSWSHLSADIDLLAGGPPCQPFSMGGKHRAHDDERDMFPATVSVLRELRPRAFIIENVKGLTRSAFASYSQYLLVQLEYPEIQQGSLETWSEHFSRLQSHKGRSESHGRSLAYSVVPTLVNAADHGVPQKRERVFIVGFRRDLGIEWSFPSASHSQEALIHDQWVTGDYWERHEIAQHHRPAMPDSARKAVARLQCSLFPPSLGAWRTVRDTLSDLPNPDSANSCSVANHRLQPGARSYVGHTGSPWDAPSKTLKAGDHGVPGGENMLVLPSGEVRYMTVRESARLQTFPDGYRFQGSWSETMRQLGNAVPVRLAHIVARSVARSLIEHKLEEAAASVSSRRHAA